MRLSELNTGEKGVIVKVLGHGGFRKRIVEMGFIKGKTVVLIFTPPERPDKIQTARLRDFSSPARSRDDRGSE